MRFFFFLVGLAALPFAANAGFVVYSQTAKNVRFASDGQSGLSRAALAEKRYVVFNSAAFAGAGDSAASAKTLRYWIESTGKKAAIEPLLHGFARLSKKQSRSDYWICDSFGDGSAEALFGVASKLKASDTGLAAEISAAKKFDGGGNWNAGGSKGYESIVWTLDLKTTLLVNSNAAVLTEADAARAILAAKLSGYSLVSTPPVLAGLADVSVDEDSGACAISFDVSDSDTPPASVSTSASCSNPGLLATGGLLIVGDGQRRSLVLTPAHDANGSAVITVTASDGVADASASFTFLVRPVNDPPVASDDVVSCDENSQMDIAVLANDSDADGDALAIEIISQPAHGAASLNSNSTIRYVPVKGWSGYDSFDYAVSDAAGSRSQAKVTVGVNQVNDPPVALNISITTNEDVPVFGNLSATDPEGMPVTYQIVKEPKIGTLLLSDPAAGSFQYTPFANANGADSFSYQASDGVTASNVAVVSIYITALYDAPMAVPDTFTVYINQPPLLDVLANDSNPDSARLTVSIVSEPSHGKASVDSDGRILYVPDEFIGQDSLQYSISDQVNTSSAVVTLNIAGHAPVAGDDKATTLEDTPVSIPVLANDTDADGDPLSVSGIPTLPSHGTAAVNPDGTVTYTPALNWFGDDFFDYAVSDITGGTDSARVTVTVSPVNDPPNAADAAFATAEDTPLSIPLATLTSDPEGGPTTWAIATPPAHGSTALGADGVVLYTPIPNWNGTDSFVYSATDSEGLSDTGIVTVAVTPANDPPAISQIPDQTIDEDSTTGDIAFTVDDVDDPISAVTVSAASSNSALISSTAIILGGSGPAKTLKLTPNANAHGSAAITVSASDGKLSSAMSFNLIVRPVNDPPITADDNASTMETTPVVLAPLANDIDVDGDTLSISISTPPAHGKAVLNVDKTITYTPADGFYGKDSMVYLAFDGTASTAGKISITVSPILTEGDTQPVSLSTSSGEPNEASMTSCVSANGYRSAFDSIASNIVPNDGNFASDVFLRDLRSNQTILVSETTAGGVGDRASDSPSISSDGNRVAFETLASNLFAGDAYPGFQDIAVRKIDERKTVPASCDLIGRLANADSHSPAISADGRFVAFVSKATNLVPNVSSFNEQIFLKNIEDGTVIHVSASTSGFDAAADADCASPSVSADGRYVAFVSKATNLAFGLSYPSPSNVFLRDTVAKTTTLLSVPWILGQKADADSLETSISSDGCFVAFSSLASNLVPNDANGASDVFVFEVATGVLSFASAAPIGSSGNGASNSPSISADGRYVAFASDATNLVPSDSNMRTDIFVRDVFMKTTIRASVDLFGVQADGNSTAPSISPEGRCVTFTSMAANLIHGMGWNYPKVYVHFMK